MDLLAIQRLCDDDLFYIWIKEKKQQKRKYKKIKFLSIEILLVIQRPGDVEVLMIQRLCDVDLFYIERKRQKKQKEKV